MATLSEAVDTANDESIATAEEATRTFMESFDVTNYAAKEFTEDNTYVMYVTTSNSRYMNT
ncbi:MAG: hypothetical protein GY861_28925 [bacterium]|nr:hypothetical protein [bacterium]